MGTKAPLDAKPPDFFPSRELGVRTSPSESSSSSISPSSDTFAPGLLPAEAELTLARLERSAGASNPVTLDVSFSGDFLFLAKGGSSSLLKLMKSPGFD